MRFAEIIAVLLIVIVVLSGPLLVRQTWINKDRWLEHRTAHTFYRSQLWRNGHVRAGTVLTAGANLTILFPALGLILDPNNSLWKTEVLGPLVLAHVTFVIPSFLSFLSTLVLYFSIILFNRPRILVPPDLRSEQGVLHGGDAPQLEDGRQVDLDGLGTYRFYDYAAAHLPDPRDEEVSGVVAGLTTQAREDVSRACARTKGTSVPHVLCLYGQRMAAMALRTSDAEYLRRALVATVISGMCGAQQESLPILSLVEDAARQIGVDVQRLFTEVSAVVSPQGSTELMLWLGRPDEQRTIEWNGFQQVSHRDGTRYQVVGEHEQ